MHPTTRDLALAEAFELHPDDQEWGVKHSQYIDAGHACGLPGVACDGCGNTWAATGVQYPTIACATVRQALGRRSRRTVLLETFSGYAPRLADIAGDRVLVPGTKFGPLHGKLKGAIGDFNWLNPWTPLVSEQALRKIEAELGFSVTGEWAALVGPSVVKHKLFEPECLPTASIKGQGYSEPACKSCGRTAGSVPDELVVEVHSVRPDIFIQRIRQYPTVLIAGRKTATAIEKLGLSNIRLEPLKTV